MNNVEPQRSARWRATAAGIAVAAAIGLGACGSNDDAHPGQTVARQNGCAGCHGSNGQGQVGPAFVGLFGSDVVLDDGTTVIADEDYLRSSILDPGAQVVEGYNVPMPRTELTPEEVDQIVAYIMSLSDEATDS